MPAVQRHTRDLLSVGRIEQTGYAKMPRQSSVASVDGMETHEEKETSRRN